MNPPLSVVIPNYNYGRFLAQTIESALEADEIIVVDDGSTDDSLEIARRYPVKIIQQRNQGVGVARNRGIEAATGELIAFLDADDYFLPHAIDTYKSAMENADLCTIAMREVDPAGIAIRDHLPAPIGWVAGIETKATISGSSFCFRRTVSERFDEDPLIHPSEDWDFIYRVSSKYRVKALDNVLVCWRQHGNNAHLKIQNMERSMTAVYKKLFSNGAPHKRESYANLHSILCGSYLHAHDYSKFVKHGLKSLYYHPKVMLSRLPINL
jgi:glycosyltransferase involved in cell wall biosynthesis